MRIDFGKTATDYAAHRAGFPAAFFDRLEVAGVLRPGVSALDLGTGTGTIARGLAARGADVLGLDTAAAQIEAARSLARAASLPVRFEVAAAERTGLHERFDLITAGQCWHWFERDRAAAEVHRLLRPGAAAVIAHLDWLREDDGVVDRTLALMERFGARFPEALLELGTDGFYPRWPGDLKRAGLIDIETWSFELDVEYTRASSRGRIRASAAIGATLSAPEVERFDRALEAQLERSSDRLAIPHRVFVVSGRRSTRRPR